MVEHLRATGKLIPELLDLLARQHFEVAPVQQHKQDIPRLVSHYLDRFSKEYSKKIHKVSPETLGIFINYDWPGNLTELANVVRRAVMLVFSVLYSRRSWCRYLCPLGAVNAIFSMPAVVELR